MSSGGGLRALLQSGGGKALYAGVLGNLAGVVPASAIFMGVYEPVKGVTSRNVRSDRQFLAPLAGGIAAGLAASIVRVPTEVVKQRMQTGKPRCPAPDHLKGNLGIMVRRCCGHRRVPGRAASRARNRLQRRHTGTLCRLRLVFAAGPAIRCN